MERNRDRQVTRLRPLWQRCRRWFTLAVLGFSGWSSLPTTSAESEAFKQSEKNGLSFGESLFQRSLRENGQSQGSVADIGDVNLKKPFQNLPSLSPAVLPQNAFQITLKDQSLSKPLFPHLSQLAAIPPLAPNLAHQTQQDVLSHASEVAGGSKIQIQDSTKASVSPNTNAATAPTPGSAPLSLLSRATGVPLSASFTSESILNGFEAGVANENEDYSVLQVDAPQPLEPTDERQESEASDVGLTEKESHDPTQQKDKILAADPLPLSRPSAEVSHTEEFVGSTDGSSTSTAETDSLNQTQPTRHEQSSPSIHEPSEAGEIRETDENNGPAEALQEMHTLNESDPSLGLPPQPLNMEQENPLVETAPQNGLTPSDLKGTQPEGLVGSQSSQDSTPTNSHVTLESQLSTPSKSVHVNGQLSKPPHEGTTVQRLRFSKPAPDMPAVAADQQHPVASLINDSGQLNPNLAVPHLSSPLVETFHRGPELENASSSSHPFSPPDSVGPTRVAESLGFPQPVDGFSSFLSTDSSPLQRVPLHSAAVSPSMLVASSQALPPESSHFPVEDPRSSEASRESVHSQYISPQLPVRPAPLVSEQQIDQQLQQLQHIQQEQTLQQSQQFQQRYHVQQDPQFQPEGTLGESGNIAQTDSPQMRSQLLSPLDLGTQLLSHPLAVVQETVGRVGPMLGLSNPAPSSAVRSVEGVSSALASPGHAFSVAQLASEASTLSAAANNIASTGNSFMNALPLDQMVDMAKAVQSISDQEEESLRNPSLQPGVRCANGGITCCVPEAMAPRDWKRRPPLLNDSDEKQKHCRAHFVPIQNALCATTTYEGDDTCGLSKTETQEYEVYRHVLVMRNKGQRAVCECRRLKSSALGAEEHAASDGQHQPGKGFEGFATWEVTQDQRKQQKEMKENSARMAQGLGTTLKVAQFLGEKGPETLQALQALQSPTASSSSPSLNGAVPVNAVVSPSFTGPNISSIAPAQAASVPPSSYAIPSPVYLNPNYTQHFALPTANNPQVLVGASAESSRRDIEAQQQQELMQRQLAHQQSVQHLLALQQQQQQIASLQQQSAVSQFPSGQVPLQNFRSAPQIPVQPSFEATPYFSSQKQTAVPPPVQASFKHSPLPNVDDAALHPSTGGQPSIGLLPSQVALQDLQPQIYGPGNSSQQNAPSHVGPVQMLQQPPTQVLQQPPSQPLQQVPQNQVQVVQMHAHTQPVAPPQPTGVLSQTHAGGMAAKAAAAVNAVMNATPKKDNVSSVTHNTNGGSKSDVSWMGRVADALLEESNRTPGGAAINRALDDFLAVAKRAV